jgi:hypothetical protein
MWGEAGNDRTSLHNKEGSGVEVRCCLVPGACCADFREDTRRYPIWSKPCDQSEYQIGVNVPPTE